MKIVFLGDSLVWGGYGGNFVAEVAARLPEHTIVNAGIGGQTVLNQLARLDAVLDEGPDGIFIFVGGNDAISYSQPQTRRYYQYAQHIPGGLVTPEDFTQAYRDLLTRVQLAHVLAWAGLEPSEYSRQAVAALQVYNAHARAVAASLNVPVFDLMALLSPPDAPERPPLALAYINLIGQRVSAGWTDYEAERQRGGFTYSFDGLHLTPESARRVADWIVAFLKPYLS